MLTSHMHAPGQVCDMIQTDSLFLTIYENSTLYFPAMPHLVELPKIELFMLNGFPFTRWPDGFESTLYLADDDPRTAAAALNLIGLITQKNGFPLFGIQLVRDKPEQVKGELIVLGRPGSVPEALRRAAPLQFAATSRVAYPVVRGWDTEAALAYSSQASGLGPGRGILMQFQSPFVTGRTVLMLTAERAEDILGASEALLDAGVQAASHGDFVLIELTAPEPKVTAMAVGEKYTTGKQGNVSAVDAFLFAHPYVLAGIAACALGGLGFALFAAIRRYRAARSARGER